MTSDSFPSAGYTATREGNLIDARLKAALRALLGDRLSLDEPLSKYTSLRVGGPAAALAEPSSREELRSLLALCREAEVPVFVLGGGFNSIASDARLEAVVLRLHGLRLVTRDAASVTAEAGATHSRVTRFCADAGLSGLEFAVGIPGTVGGWLAMNAGIGSREMKDVVERIEFIDLRSGEAREMKTDQLRFRYRALEVPEGALLLSARFATQPGSREAIREQMREQMTQRRATQPVDQPSCGSVFKNPPGEFAGKLIEAAGLKGSSVGSAEISTVHANFIVNRGGASASDVFALIDRTRAAVLRQFGVELEPEVRVIGGGD